MAVFEYRVRSQSGTTTGIVEAPDRREAARTLRDRGLQVLAVREKRKETKNNFLTFLNRISLKEKMLFTSNLGAMIEAGLSLSRALNILEKETKNPKFRNVIQGLNNNVNKGKSFHESLQEFPKVFPPIFTAMVAAGEESGRLPESLKTIATQMEKTYSLRRKIRGAMIYPVIVLTVIIIIGVLMMIYLVPTLAETFESLGAELPVQTRFVIALSDFLLVYGLYLLPLTLFFFFFLWRGLKTERGRRLFAFFLLHVPVIKNIVKASNAALTMRTLSSLVASGVSMVRAIEITRDIIQNPYYIAVLFQAQRQVEKGESLAAVFQQAETLYPVLVGEMIAVGEETGKLADMLLRGAIFYEEEVDQATKNISTFIEPLLMILVGIGVLFFAIAMIQPMYSLSEII